MQSITAIHLCAIKKFVFNIKDKHFDESNIELGF
jgi:hypothetical protein